MEDNQHGKNMVGRKGAGVPGLRADAQRRKGEPAAFFDSNPGTEVPWLRERFRDHGEGGGRLYDFDRFTTDMFIYGRARCYVRRGQPMTPITDEQLAAIKAGLEGVTPGPWGAQPIEEVGEGRGTACIVGGNLGGLVAVACSWPTEIDAKDWTRTEANATHIARMDPTTVASLIARIEAAEARVKWLEEALEPFANNVSSWLARTPDDCGVVKPHAKSPAITLGDLRRARAALEGK